MMHLDDHAGVGVLRIEHGKVNELDIALLDAMTEQLRAAEGLRALVITGTGKVFSAGADLVGVLAADDATVRDGVRALAEAFGTLFAFPRPVVAAINGHAIAGGCIIACACDHRVMGPHGTIGLAELRVGVPFPAAALEVVRFAVRPRYLQQLVYLGENFAPVGALERGLVDEVVPQDQVLDRAIEVAEQLASIPPSTFAHTKRALRRDAIAAIQRYGPDADAEAARIWSSPEGRGAIEGFLAKLAAR
jgi:enoyl-CoA hydratase